MSSKTEEIKTTPYLHFGYVRSDTRIETKMGIYGERSLRGDFYGGFRSGAWLDDVWYRHRKQPQSAVHPVPAAYPSHPQSYRGTYPQVMWFHPYVWTPGLVSIITVTYNSREPLRELINSWLLHQSGMPCEWIFVDNDSAPEQREYVEQWGGTRIGDVPVQTILNKENRKFTPATNQGIAAARGEYVLLLNPDIEVTQAGWLKRMVDDMAQVPGGVICGNKQLYPDGTIVHAGGEYRACQVSGKDGPEHRGCEVHSRTGEVDTGQYDRVEEVPWVTGSCMLIHRRAFIALGYLDELTYPHYGSDRVFSEEARRHGFAVVYSPVPVIHKHGRSSSNG